MIHGRYDDKDDRELLNLFYADGNNEWLGVLLQRYTGMLLGVSMKYLKNEEDAMDSVQQIFLKVISELQKYKVTWFKSWLYMIAKNHCLMKLRDKNLHPQELSEKMIPAQHETGEKTPAEKETELTRLEAAVALLNDEQRECIILFYFRKKTYQQISALTSFSVMQVKSNIQNGKRNLKIQMQRTPDHEQ